MPDVGLLFLGIHAGVNLCSSSNKEYSLYSSRGNGARKRTHMYNKMLENGNPAEKKIKLQVEETQGVHLINGRWGDLRKNSLGIAFSSHKAGFY